MDNDSNNANNYAIMSGVISNGAGGIASGLVKNGPGLLILTAVNTYGDGAGYDVARRRSIRAPSKPIGA